MPKLNENYQNVKDSYLFAEIARRVKVYEETHLEKAADIIRLGIGDVTLPLTKSVIEALHEAVDSQAVSETFKGYGPEQGYAFAQEAIRYGVTEYILKPVDPQEFKNVMDSVMSYLDKKKQNEEAMQKNQEFLGQYFLHKFIHNGKSEIMDDAMKILDVSWWNRTGRMLLLNGDDGFFENYDGDFEQMLTEELPFSFHYLNYDSDSSILCFEQNVKVDFQILAKHIFEFVEKSCGRQIYIAVSSQLEGKEAIPQGMKELESLMENRYYRADQWIFMPDTNWENKENYELPLEMVEKMEEDIRLHDIAHLWEHYNKFMKYKEYGAGFSYIYMNFVCTNLIKSMYTQMDYPVEKYSNVIEKMFHVENIQEVAEALEETIHLFEQKLFSVKNSNRSEVEKVKSYIYAHYQEDINLEFLSAEVYLSPGYMSYIFKKETGEGLAQFIRKFRLEKAKELLCTTNKKIVQVCAETGFTNPSYFCKSFREYYGCSPDRFRKNEIQRETM